MNGVPDFPDIEVLAAPLYFVLMLVELVLIAMRRGKGEYEARDTLTSLSMGVISVVTGALFAGGFEFLLFAAYEWRIADPGFGIAAVVACFVLDDLRYYWAHRLGHRVRWFWANHVIHHSSQHFNLSTALRQPWSGPINFLIVLQLPIAWLGFHPALIAFVYGLNLIYQFWIHTEAIDRMPRWFEAVFNTPSHHRVHHGSNPRYLDANYAGTLIVWDKLFGSFVPEQDDEPVHYGLVKDLGTFSPIRVALHEYVAILRDLFRPGLGWAERIGYVIAPPGWSHDGSRMTSEQIKADFVARHPEEGSTPGLTPVGAAAAPAR